MATIVVSVGAAITSRTSARDVMRRHLGSALKVQKVVPLRGGYVVNNVEDGWWHGQKA